MPAYQLKYAAKDRACTGYRCGATIRARTPYLRAVAFPGDEGNEEGTRPWVLNLCPQCADPYGNYIRQQYGLRYTLGDQVTALGEPGRVAGSTGAAILVLVNGQIKPYGPRDIQTQHAKETP